jgi:L-fuculose-phosphate aldolase
MLSAVGLASGVRSSLGHVSVRVPGEPDKFVVKGRGYRMDELKRIRPEDLVVCDLDGMILEGPRNIVPCFEVKIHSCILKARPDVNSVVHVHPTYTVLMTVLGQRLRPMCQEGAALVDSDLPVYMHQKIVTSDAEGTELAQVLGGNTAALLFGHGAVTVGTNMQQSISNMIHLEHQAQMNYLAYAAAGKDHPYVPDNLRREGEGFGSQFDLPHFKHAFEKQGRPMYGGVWEAWYQDAGANI